MKKKKNKAVRWKRESVAARESSLLRQMRKGRAGSMRPLEGQCRTQKQENKKSNQAIKYGQERKLGLQCQ